MEWLVGLLAVLLVGGGVGFWAGYWHGRRHGAEAVERMSRVLDVPHHEGEPHNFLADPARTSKARIRNRRAWHVQD